MDYSKGMTVSYYGHFVDPASWRDVERFELISGSVSTELTELRASASFDCKGYPQNTERYIRLYMDATQAGETVHIPLFTGLATSPEDNVKGTWTENTVTCYSVLKLAEDVLLPRGWYAPVETSGAVIIRQLLEDLKAPIETADNAPTLQEAIIAEDGETKLSMMDRVLTAMDWRVRLTGAGVVQIVPKDEQQRLVISEEEFDIIEPELDISRDWYSAPNCFRAISNDLSATARDDSPNSYLSTVNRGREVWTEETDCALSAGESIADYALRRLREQQKIETLVKYNRRFVPDLTAGDVVQLHFPDIGLQGQFQISSQSIELDFAARTNEEAVNL